MMRSGLKLCESLLRHFYSSRSQKYIRHYSLLTPCTSAASKAIMARPLFRACSAQEATSHSALLLKSRSH